MQAFRPNAIASPLRLQKSYFTGPKVGNIQLGPDSHKSFRLLLQLLSAKCKQTFSTHISVGSGCGTIFLEVKCTCRLTERGKACADSPKNGRERVLSFPSPSQVSIEKPLFSFPASQFVRVFRRKSLCANPVFFRSSTGQFPKVVRSEK